MAIKQISFSGNSIKTKEIKVEGAATPQKRYGDEYWRNDQATPIKSISAIVPYTLIGKLAAIETKMNSRMEFGAFIKGHFNETGDVLIVDDDIYIPQQEVSAATVDFHEDEPQGFNGVIHRHPNGCNSFSSTDDTFINSNYEFSLLYVNGDVKQGIINLKVGAFRYQLPLTIRHGNYCDDDIDISNITIKYIPPVTPVGRAAGVNPVVFRPGASKKSKFRNDASILDFRTLDDLYGDVDDDSLNVPTDV